MITWSDNWRTLTLSGTEGSWFWEPKNDLTAQELAMAMIPLLLNRADLVAALPPPAQRHFRRERGSGTPDRMNAPMPDRALNIPDDREKLEELTAVTGKDLPPGVWVSIGVPFLVTEDHEFAVAVRLKPGQEVQE